MKRKVIQIADSTQLVSLPRKWALKFGIKKGDELEITETDNRLLVSTGKLAEKGSIEVDVTNMDRDLLMYLIRSLYIVGYDEIKLNYKRTEIENYRLNKQEQVIDIITLQVAKLSGIEIFNQKEGQCIIKNISSENPKEFDSILKRIFILSAETVSDLIRGYEKGNKSLLETIQGKHDAVTRFVSYCLRLLSKAGYEESRKKEILFHILEEIDKIMDLIKYNARDLINKNFKPNRRGLSIYKKVLEAYNRYHDLYYNFSLKKVSELNKMRYEVKDLIDNYSKDIAKGEMKMLVNMEQAFEDILSLVIARMTLEY